VKLHVDPSFILVPTRINDEILDCLQLEQARLRNYTATGMCSRWLTRILTQAGEQASALSYSVQIRATKEFKYESGKSKLMALNMSTLVRSTVRANPDLRIGMGDDYRTRENLFQISGLLETCFELAVSLYFKMIKLIAQVGCAGALIGHLNRCRAERFLPGDNNASEFFRIQRIQLFSVHGSM
jgi:hypothetical protein